MIAWLAATALAADGTAPDAQALEDVLAGAIERYRGGLELPEAPEIYHLRYQLLELGQVDVQASMGSIISTGRDMTHALGVEIRVGEPAFDNTGFGGWQNGFVRAVLPEVLTPESVAVEAWRSTDRAYKEAVEQYARKAAQFTPPPDWPGDYTLTGAVTADGGVGVPEATPDRLKALAKSLSGAMSDPRLVRAEVYVGHEAGFLLTVDSEGSRVRAPLAETTIRALAQVRASDGALITDQRLWTVRGVEDLPDDRELIAAVDQMEQGLLSLIDAPSLDEEYVGPVLFEGTAATDLYRYLLVQQLEGTPAEIPFDSWFGELGAFHDPVRIGRRVLPEGWTVVDDPQRLPKHPGAYRWDQEGTPAQRIELVDDGIVRTLAMSRVPRRGLEQTNGHARGFVGQRAEGRLSQFDVTPDRAVSDAKLHKLAIKTAKAYGRDSYLVVRRLQEPCVMGLGTDLWFDEDETPLPPPVQLVRRHLDGTEEVLRGAAFAGVERWLLRDVVAAGGSVEADFMAPLQGGYGGQAPTEGIASHVRAPSVLVGEVELVPVPGDPRELPALPPPPLAGK